MEIELYKGVYVGCGCLVGSGYYRVNCVKYPFHKEDVGYKGCCPKVGDREYDISYRDGWCSINCLNSDEYGHLNRVGLELGLNKAIEMYNGGSSVCFVGNNLDSLCVLMGGVFLSRLGLVEFVDYNDMLLFLKSKVEVFSPKSGQVFLFMEMFDVRK